MPRRKAPGPSRRRGGDCGKIVISTRVRLARNLAKAKFPQWASEHEREETFRAARDAIAAAGDDIGQTAVTIRVTDSEGIADKFCDSNLISRDLVDGANGAGFAVLTPKGHKSGNPLLNSIVVMVNEEDHFRIQSFREGYDLDGAWEAADKFDTALSHHAEYAFSKQLGYLTACPSNVGTGLRASVMVTLPGLLVCDELEAVFRAVERLGYNVRGMYGEGTKSSAPSFLAQISNRGTLGMDERGVIASLRKVVDEIVRVETQARLYAMRHDTLYLADEVSRSLGLIKSALFLSHDECVSALNMVRFGAEIGFVEGCDPLTIDEILRSCGDGAMRSMGMGGHSKAVEEMSEHEDYPDVLRAMIVQSLLGNAEMVLPERF